MVIDGWGATVGSVSKSGWFAYRPTILDIFPQRINTDEAWKTSLRFRTTAKIDIKILAEVLTNDFSGLGLKKVPFDHE